MIYDATLFSGKGAPEGQGYENWSHVTVGPEGDIYVSEFLGNQFAVHHSFDGGQSIQPSRPGYTRLCIRSESMSTSAPDPISDNPFRLQVVRAIVADPMRPGYVYVADGNQVYDAAGAGLDEGDVDLRRSTDYGVTWQTTFQSATRWPT